MYLFSKLYPDEERAQSAQQHYGNHAREPVLPNTDHVLSIEKKFAQSQPEKTISLPILSQQLRTQLSKYKAADASQNEFASFEQSLVGDVNSSFLSNLVTQEEFKKKKPVQTKPSYASTNINVFDNNRRTLVWTGKQQQQDTKQGWP